MAAIYLNHSRPHALRDPSLEIGMHGVILRGQYVPAWLRLPRGAGNLLLLEQIGDGGGMGGPDELLLFLGKVSGEKLNTVIEEYAAKIGIKLKQIYDAETLSGGMSLVASTGGFTLLPIYVQNALIPSVVARPLHGEVPTIDLVMGYNKSNTSPLLKKFLLRADELAANGPRVQRSSIRTNKEGA